MDAPTPPRSPRPDPVVAEPAGFVAGPQPSFVAMDRLAPSPPDPPGVETPRRPRWAAVCFHVTGLVLFGGAGWLALIALWLLSFGTSVCGGDPGDPQLVRDLRLGTMAVTAALALVPAAWGVIARWTRFAWSPWLAAAGVVTAGGAALAATTDEVASFCLF